MASEAKGLEAFSTVGIVGAGIMGIGIAEVMAASGRDVVLVDLDLTKVTSAVDRLAARLEKRVQAGKTAAEKRDAILSRIRPTADLRDVSAAGLVIEAIVEQIEPKRALIEQLESVLRSDARIATNTSSLSVTSIAARAANPARIAGFHFFNPVPVMRIVEVIKGARTNDILVQELVQLAQAIGHTPVQAKDTPGFIVNHAGRAFVTEALTILKEGVAPIPVIDAILREGAGFRMGPFELMDLTGLDVSHPVMETVYDKYYQDARYRPSFIAQTRVEAGLLGRKTGAGFYAYGNGETLAPPPVIAGELPSSVRIIDDGDGGEMRILAEAAGIPVVQAGEDPNGLILAGVIGEDCTTAALRLGTNPSKTICFDRLFGLSSHRTLIASPASDDAARGQALALARHDGIQASLIDDSSGAICQRTLAMIVNIASEIVSQDIATAEDVDRAVRLGLGYPFGPLEWGDRIGATRIVTILDAIHSRTLDPRYRASLWLRRRAELGMRLNLAGQDAR